MAAHIGDSMQWRRQRSSAHRSQERLLLKDRILDGISRSIKQIQELHISRGPTSPLVLTNQDWELNRLCEHLDHALLHGLRSVTRGYWVIVREFTHSTSVKEIKTLTNVTTELGRGRSWLFMALNDGLLESYVRCFENNMKIVKKYYVKEALVLDSERLEILLTLVSGLDFITFSLTYDSGYLDFSCHCPGVESPSNDDNDDKISICSMESAASQMPDRGGRARTESMMPLPWSQGHDDLSGRPRSISAVLSQSSPQSSVALGDSSQVRGSWRESEDGRNEEDDEADIEVIRVKSKKKKKKKKSGSHHGSSSSTPVTPVTPVTPGQDPPVFTDSPHSNSNDQASQTQSQLTQPESQPTQSQSQLAQSRVEQVSSPSQSEASHPTEVKITLTKPDPVNSPSEHASIVRDSTVGDQGPPDLDLIERAILNGPAIRTQPSEASLHAEMSQVQPSASATSFNIYDFKNRTSISSQGSSGSSNTSVSGLVAQSKDEHALFQRRPSEYNKSDFEVITEEQDQNASAIMAEKAAKSEPKLEKSSDMDEREKLNDVVLDDSKPTLSSTSISDVLDSGEAARSRRDVQQKSKSQRGRSGAFNENDSIVIETGAEHKIFPVDTDGQSVQSLQKHNDDSEFTNLDQANRERKISDSIYNSATDKHSDQEDKTHRILGRPNDLDLSQPEDLHQFESEDTESAEEFVDDMDEIIIRKNSDKPRQLNMRLDNNSKLFLMLEVFQTEDEQFHAMYPTSLGHTDGNTQRVFVMLTSSAIYILTPGPGRGKYNKETVIRYEELDYVELSVNFQVVHIVCTNRRKQHWITTGDEELTRDLVKSLEEAVRKCEVDLLRLSVLTDATTQKIAMKKWLSQECGIQASEVELLCYSLVHWEDTNSRTRGGITKEGTLLVKTPNNLYSYTWKAAYFVLRDGLLLQFPNKNDSKEPERTIQLGGEDCCGCRRAHDANRENCFEIILSDNNTIQMSASNESETFDWLQTLCKAVSEGMGAPGGVGLLPCCTVLTPNRLFMCHEDLQTNFFRTIGCANVLDVTGITIDPTEERYCIVEFESQDRKVSSEQWIIYFASTKEQRKFIEALSDAWKRHFQVSIPVNIFDDMALQWKCKDIIANALAPLSIS